MKKIIAVILALTFCLSFVACAEKSYKDDVTSVALASEIQRVAKNESGYRKVESDFASFNLKGASDYCTDYAIYLSNQDTDMNEFGVFHTASAKDAKEVEKICKSYLEKKNENWNPDYLPEQYPKIKDATTFILGNYVVYMVLDENDRLNVKTAATEFLTDNK